MKLKQFGSTGLMVSDVGFGGSRIGGVFAEKDSNRQALAVLHRALDSGINFFDTADMYAQGESEVLIGTAFRDRRDKVVIATKGGYCLPARRNFIKRIKPLVRPLVQALGLKRARLPSAMSGALSQDFSPAYLARALEASLRRLKTDYVDLYQLHSPSAEFMQSEPFGGAMEALSVMQRQGKIRHFGIATEVPADAPFCLDVPGVSSVQIGFGLLDLEAQELGTLAAAHERGIAVIARGCFAGGYLKPSLTEEALRELTPKWQRIMALRAFGSSRGRSALELALHFCRSTPEVTVTLLGMRLESHLTDILDYYNTPGISEADYSALVRCQGI